MSDTDRQQANALLDQIAARMGDGRTVATLARLATLVSDPAARELRLVRPPSGKVQVLYTDAL